MLLQIVQTVNTYLSDYILVVLLIAVGLWFSIKTRFVQVRCFGEGMRRVFGSLSLNGAKHKSGMSSFQALATAIAAQVGTGNIVGASGAILTGGPGAIFWMWIIAFFGMATIYAEATLAQQTRVKDEQGNIQGGPVYYITTAFQGAFGKFLAGFFAVAIILALGFFGCMVQSNSIGSTFETAFGIPAWIVGVVLVTICAVIFLGGVQRLAAVTEKLVPIMAAVFLLGSLVVLVVRIQYVVLVTICAVIFLGGVQRLAAVTEKLVPIMAAVFLLGSLVVLVVRIQYLPATFGMIFRYAFAPNAIIGGGLGTALKIAISQGAKRGLFSNEAGMGSTPHAHALANVKAPHEQGVVAMVGVFIDTFVVLTLNALVIISTLYTADGPLAAGYTDTVAQTLSNTNLAQTAFGTVMGAGLGAKFVAVCLFFFAFSTILGWNLFGKINVAYLFGRKATTVYMVIALVFIFLGTVTSSDLVWGLSDMFNQLMVIPNAIALFALTNIVVRVAHRKTKQKK